jgi:polysaccharide biosynthesis transport protein
MDRDKSTEFSDYVNSLRRRRRLILAIWLPIVLFSLLLVVALPSEFGSTATFQLKTELSDQGKGDNYADRYIAGLTGNVLASPALRAQLPKLLPYPELRADPTAALKRLKGDLDVVMLTQKILDPLTGLERKINTGFTVTYLNRDPAVAQRVAAWVSDAFMTESRRVAAAEVLNESRFYAAEADRQKEKIAESESRLADFKQANFDRLPDSTQANLNVKSMTDQELSGVERDLRAQEQNRTFILQQLQQARAGGVNLDTLRSLENEYQKKAAVYDPNHPDMIALRRQIEATRSGNLAADTSSNLQAQLTIEEANLAEMRQRYSEDHPDVKRLERTIQNQKARIAAGEKDDPHNNVGRTPAVVQLETQLNGVEAQISALQEQRRELRASQANLQGRLQSTPEVEVTYDNLTRDVNTARRLFEQLNNKRVDAEVKAAAIKLGTADQFTLVTAPQVPTAPTKPPRIGIALIGLIGATFLAFMITLGAMALDTTVRGTHDVLTHLNIPPIAVVPVIRNAAFAVRRRRQLTAWAAVIVVAVPAVYFLIRFASGGDIR